MSSCYRLPALDRFTNAALAYAKRCEDIAELTRQAKAVPSCEVPDPEGHGGQSIDYCTDRMEDPGGFDYPPSKVVWWEMAESQIATLCTPCRSRVDLWRERYRLRQTLGGLKRALLQAYRAHISEGARSVDASRPTSAADCTPAQHPGGEIGAPGTGTKGAQ